MTDNTDYATLYAGLTNKQIENAQLAEPCAHGATRGTCGSSMCHVWTIDELNDEREPDEQLDPNDIPFPAKPH